MTRVERSAIINAMKLIHTDEDQGGSYEAGMDMLADLVGLDGFRWKLVEAEPLKIFELAQYARTRRAAEPHTTRESGKEG